jgi:tryptophan 7-halogenase
MPAGGQLIAFRANHDPQPQPLDPRHRHCWRRYSRLDDIGVGEATIPMIQRFNRIIGIDENEFLRETLGTFKLGIEFVNWGRKGERYMHGFGRLGQDLFAVSFDQYWHRLRAAGKAMPLENYSITRMAAKANKFMPARDEMGNSPLADIAYAYHFDANLYASYLRRLSESRGVQRSEGKITHATRRSEGDRAGDVQAIILESGARIEGDLFIDCTGFRGLLIEQTLQTGFEDWGHWLPCDRALAVPCESVKPLTPYTRSTAHRAGWQWRIPLQHRTGNGHVFCSQYVGEDEAAATLLANLDGKALSDPRLVKFQTGMRRKAWSHNVVAIGLASGFLEPLESTSIHLIQAAIQQLIDFFPGQGFSQVDIDEFNAQSRFHYERIRDFIILHYHINQRDDSEFWRACAHMDVPQSLKDKIALYRSHGRIFRFNNELFAEMGWLQVMEGQNLVPQRYHPLADLPAEQDSVAFLESVRQVISKCVDVMPDHAAYVAQHCRPQLPIHTNDLERRHG